MDVRADRRRFLKTAAGFAAGGLAGAFVSGCAAGVGSSAFAVPSAVPTYGTAGGARIPELKWGLPLGEPDTIDPPNTGGFSSGMVAANLCDPLLRLNPDYSTSPNLATARQDDPQTVVFTLRNDVRFWNGDPLTADDVVWSLRHSFSLSTVTGALYTAVQSVEKTGPLEVTVRFHYPDALFLPGMSNLAGMIQQASYARKAGDALGSAQAGLIGTGPYRLEKWTPGSGITLSANPHYWNPQLQPHAEKVQLAFTTDSGALAQALSTGQLDGAYEVPAAIIPRLERSKAGHLVIGRPTQLYLTLSAAGPSGPYSDPRVRQALVMTLDRKALADVVFYGAAEANYTYVNTDTWRSAGNSAQVRALWEQAYAPYEAERSTWGSPAAVKRARALLKRTAYDGQELVLGTLAGDATMSMISQLIQAQAAQAGIKVSVQAMQPIEYASASSEAKARVGLDMLIGTGFNGTTEPAEPLLFSYLPDSPYNYTGFNDKQVSGLLQEATTVLDPVDRAKLLIQVQSQIEDLYDQITLLQINEILFLRKGLAGAISSFSYLASPSLAHIGVAT